MVHALKHRAGGGTDEHNYSMYSDMIMKEFMKAGFKSKAIGNNINESSSPEEFSKLTEEGFDLLLGNFTVATTSSSLNHLSGGWDKTGVINFTIKGVDPSTREILFMMSAEYGKAKQASMVAKAVAEEYNLLINESINEAVSSKEDK